MSPLTQAHECVFTQTARQLGAEASDAMRALARGDDDAWRTVGEVLAKMMELGKLAEKKGDRA